MNGYAFPAWRRVVFVAVLTVILVVSFASSITQGGVTVRVYGIAPGGPVSHVYVRFSELAIHTAGYERDAGWITFTNLLPVVDLVPHSNQDSPESIISSRVQSGRYDAIRLQASNATVVVATSNGFPVTLGSTINANVTIPIPPNGTRDVLILLQVDYFQLLDENPGLFLDLLQVTTA